jgi:hypothetical protein
MIDREVWDSWRVNWPAVSVGALAALMGTSLGAYQETHIESWRQFQVLALIVGYFRQLLQLRDRRMDNRPDPGCDACRASDSARGHRVASDHTRCSWCHDGTPRRARR